MKIRIGHSANARLHFNYLRTTALQAQQMGAIKHQQVKGAVASCTACKALQKRQRGHVAVQECGHQFAT